MSVPGITETRQYLTFNLGEESFALDVARVREILDFTPVTKVPKTPEFMRGVINLRGSVVPVVDMRVKFNLLLTDKTDDTCIIVVEALLEEELTVLGALVDSVQEVFDLEPDRIEPVSRIGTGLSGEFIAGMGKRDDDRFVIILDPDKIFSAQELGLTGRTAGTSPPEAAEAAA